MKIFFQPLDQFDIFVITFLANIENLVNELKQYEFLVDLYALWVRFTNATLYLFILGFLFWLIASFIAIRRFKFFYKSIWQYFYEKIVYSVPYEVVITQLGVSRGAYYFRYIATTFFFILWSNLMGLIPASMALSSHIVLTFFLGATALLGITTRGLVLQKNQFLRIFVPQGIPTILLPMLVTIEVVSYFSRAFSLAIRLFANIMSGHALMHILLMFSAKTFKYHYLAGFAGLFLVFIIAILEVGISSLQAYVFIVLLSIYLKDAYQEPKAH